MFSTRPATASQIFIVPSLPAVAEKVLLLQESGLPKVSPAGIMRMRRRTHIINTVWSVSHAIDPALVRGWAGGGDKACQAMNVVYPWGRVLRSGQ